MTLEDEHNGDPYKSNNYLESTGLSEQGSGGIFEVFCNPEEEKVNDLKEKISLLQHQIKDLQKKLKATGKRSQERQTTQKSITTLYQERFRHFCSLFTLLTDERLLLEMQDPHKSEEERTFSQTILAEKIKQIEQKITKGEDSSEITIKAHIDRLQKFMKAGGKIVFTGGFDENIGDIVSGEVSKLTIKDGKVKVWFTLDDKTEMNDATEMNDEVKLKDAFSADFYFHCP